MSELLNQLWTPELQAAFTVVVVLLVILYVLSIVWVVRDAYLRGSYWYVWAIVALVPLLGIIAYCLLRPPLLQIDRDEQELEIALKQRELMKYGECANCGYPVEADFVLCPNCHQRLKNLCGTCNHALDPTWTVCPYCATPVAGGPRTRRAPQQRGARRSSRSGRRPAADEAGAPAGPSTACGNHFAMQSKPPREQQRLFCRKGGARRARCNDRAGALCAPGTGKELI
ncbi:MAG: zinc ribbon domain-containing protein [Eggerthella lenta]